MRRKAAALLLLAGVAAATMMPAPSLAAGSRPNMQALVIARRYDDALQACAETIKGLENDIAKHTPQSDPWFSLKEAEVGFYYCAEAQVYALAGEFAKADSAAGEAESHWIFHGLMSPPKALFTGPTESILAVTRGLIFEKRGKIEAARRSYLSAHSDAGDARAALLAFKAGDTAGARRLAAKGNTPTKMIVLGLIAKKEGHPAEADDWFRKAAAVLDDPGTPGRTHEFLPIYYCEPVP